MQTTQPLKDDITTLPCVACKEQIQKDAKLCPFCKSSQKRAPLSVTLHIMKWVGGITAVISLVMALVQINTFLGDWREKKAMVNELITAADIQQTSGDYSQALELLGEALKLEPFSRKARNANARIAMKVIRSRTNRQQNAVDTIKPLLPILARSAANSDERMAADVNAHMGWAYVMMTKATDKTFSIDPYFERALQQDATNVYAHAFWGYWTLSQYNDHTYDGRGHQKAVDHFNAAVTSKKERQFVRYLQVYALLNSSTVEDLCEAFSVAIHMKDENETPGENIRYRLIELFDRFRSDYPLNIKTAQAVFSKFDAKKIQETFEWLYAENNEKNLPGNVHFERYHFIVACLTAVDGEKKQALDLLKSLKSKLR
ncbi:MAG: hypothetical protein KKE61_01715, partial [Proteobacteria bacterium]|nr:hypothetical protein [Pseudomonadota bacterium]